MGVVYRGELHSRNVVVEGLRDVARTLAGRSSSPPELRFGCRSYILNRVFQRHQPFRQAACDRSLRLLRACDAVHEHTGRLSKRFEARLCLCNVTINASALANEKWRGRTTARSVPDVPGRSTVTGVFDFAGEARYQEASPPHLFAGQSHLCEALITSCAAWPRTASSRPLPARILVSSCWSKRGDVPLVPSGFAKSKRTSQTHSSVVYGVEKKRRC